MVVSVVPQALRANPPTDYTRRDPFVLVRYQASRETACLRL
jgi:hypothetical protein